MTGRISLIAAVIAAGVFSCDTERNIAPSFKTYFTKYYGEDGNQFGTDMVVGSDGSMVMVGRSESQTNPVTRSFVVKVDTEGTVLWQRRIGAENEAPVDVELDSRNDILIVTNLSGGAIRVLRLDQSGNTVDSLKVDDAAGIVATSITEVSDGQLMVAGYSGPNLVGDNQMATPPPDEQDLFIYRIDPSLDGTLNKLVVAQGGEHVGKIVKLFESKLSGPKTYLSFGDSDRPFNVNNPEYRRTFEVFPWDASFVSGRVVQTGQSPETQIAGEAIEMPIASQRGYLLVGSTGQEVSRKIFVVQYMDSRPNVTVRLSTIIPTPRSAEGVSAAYGEQDAMFVLADEKQDNNNHDIYLAKLESDGAFGGEMRFGSVEGDDTAAAVRVLPDQRVAIFGTIELETQKKMMLTLISPRGTFSE
ncbi:MAG: hypothetical protein QM762_20955 [Chryseolinea sp.]